MQGQLRRHHLDECFWYTGREEAHRGMGGQNDRLGKDRLMTCVSSQQAWILDCGQWGAIAGFSRCVSRFWRVGCSPLGFGC